jgi:hypothetical protein
VKDDEYAFPPTIPPVVRSDYREPAGRVSGNEVFRRNINGELDLEYAKHLVLDALKKYKDIGELTDAEMLILSIFMPANFNFVDPIIASHMKMTHFRLTPEEVINVNIRVSDHLAKEIQTAMSVR